MRLTRGKAVSEPFCKTAKHADVMHADYPEDDLREFLQTQNTNWHERSAQPLDSTDSLQDWECPKRFVKCAGSRSRKKTSGSGCAKNMSILSCAAKYLRRISERRNEPHMPKKAAALD
jgi:hypothetical protein